MLMTRTVGRRKRKGKPTPRKGHVHMDAGHRLTRLAEPIYKS